MSISFRLLPVLFFAGAVCAAQSQPASRPEVTTGVGLLNVFHDKERAQWMGSVEYRFSELRWSLRPWAGAAGAQHGTAFVSAGLLYAYETKHRMRLVAAFAPTFYDTNSGRDLGSAFEFHSFCELGYVAKNHHVLGVRLGHLSNGGLAKRNPGEETMLLTYSLPLTTGK